VVAGQAIARRPAAFSEAGRTAGAAASADDAFAGRSLAAALRTAAGCISKAITVKTGTAITALQAARPRPGSGMLISIPS